MKFHLQSIGCADLPTHGSQTIFAWVLRFLVVYDRTLYVLKSRI